LFIVVSEILLFGIALKKGWYPYTAVTDKQRQAMKEASVDFVYQSIFELTNNCLLKLL
jgi:hypothetical protein